MKKGLIFKLFLVLVFACSLILIGCPTSGSSSSDDDDKKDKATPTPVPTATPDPQATPGTVVPSETSNVLKINVTTHGEKNWGIQLHQDTTVDVPSGNLNLTFQVKADETIDSISITVNPSGTTDALNHVSLIPVDTSWREYTIPFTNDAAQLLQFSADFDDLSNDDVGRTASAIYIDNISISDGTTEYLASGDFETPVVVANISKANTDPYGWLGNPGPKSVAIGTIFDEAAYDIALAGLSDDEKEKAYLRSGQFIVTDNWRTDNVYDISIVSVTK